MLITRVLAALVFTPALLGLIWVGGHALAVTCMVLGALMLWEFLRLTGGRPPVLQGAAYLLGAGVLAGTLGWLPDHIAPLLAPAGALMILTVVLLQPEPLATSVQRASIVTLGIVYCAGLIPYLALLRNLPEDGRGLCWMALLCTWGSDTGAYFAGRLWGKHKLYPQVSPGKTIEGGVGGVVWALAIALAVRAVFHVNIGVADALVLGAVASLFGVLGDLSESMLKRSVGAKDSSNLIPGHGGVLDRFDGVMFAVPAFYIYVIVFIQGGAAP